MLLTLLQNPHVLTTLTRRTIPWACHAKRHLNVQKWSEHVLFLTLLTWKCASRHNGMHFFHIANSKSAPNMMFFCAFWLPSVLRATTGCTCSTSQLPKVLWTRADLCISTSKFATTAYNFSCFIAHLPTWLRTRRFSAPTFQPSGATKHWKKHSVSRLFYLFVHLHLLSSDSFSSLIFFPLLFSSLLWLPSLLFHLFLFSEVWLLKLPSVIYLYTSYDLNMWPGHISCFHPFSLHATVMACLRCEAGIFPLISTWCSAARSTVFLQHLPLKSLPLCSTTDCANEIQRLNKSCSWDQYSSVFGSSIPVK